jgi:hypothetical protein
MDEGGQGKQSKNPKFADENFPRLEWAELGSSKHRLIAILGRDGDNGGVSIPISIIHHDIIAYVGSLSVPGVLAPP